MIFNIKPINKAQCSKENQKVGILTVFKRMDRMISDNCGFWIVE